MLVTRREEIFFKNCISPGWEDILQDKKNLFFLDENVVTKLLEQFTGFIWKQGGRAGNVLGGVGKAGTGHWMIVIVQV